MKKTLGGDRLGSGQKNKVYMNNYNRSTHDLSQKFTSSMTCGALYPFLVMPAMRGDKFTIKTHADVITIPTQGPLFGSFKFQIDYFQCDVRLYQALLHNNPLALGLKTQQVMLPTYRMAMSDIAKNAAKINKSSLWAYLGLSGLGRLGGNTSPYSGARRFNAVPLLAYYDIFKTYYANKQEENAYAIHGGEQHELIDAIFYKNGTSTGSEDLTIGVMQSFGVYVGWESGSKFHKLSNEERVKVLLNIKIGYKYYAHTNWNKTTINDLTKQNNLTIQYQWTGTHVIINMRKTQGEIDTIWLNGNRVSNLKIYDQYVNDGSLKLQSFPLKNIDDMRMSILSSHTLGVAYEVSGYQSPSIAPYTWNDIESSQDNLNGLVVKTYQSDIYNNWVNTEFIDGENGIAAITAIQPEEDGSIKIDEILLKEKLYNLMNRIAVSGATYEDYLDAAYEETNRRAIEAPIYLGGMSSEIVFEQIVQTAPGGEADPLGTLAGRGRHMKRKGGNLTVKVDQPAFIIGIASLTPRITYSQGNEFYLTDIKSIFDFHKPAMDGIGFQNLIGERLAWFDTVANNDETIERNVVGKIPAWLEYMTAVDKTYGDFASGDKSFMVLNRDYEYDDETNRGIKDVTTYIDPTKYNYAFAYADIDAQNFWAEIYCDIKARRLMSAKVIPTI